MYKNSTRIKLRRLRHKESAIDIAIQIIKNEGFLNLSMTDVASKLDVSVGSLYQLFSCKEELLSAIALRGTELLKELIKRAVNFDGRPREQIMAVHLAHTHYSNTYPVAYQAAYLSNIDGISQKISKESHDALKANMQEVMGLAVQIVERAIESGDLRLPSNVTPQDIVYSFWALRYGNIALSAFNLCKQCSQEDKILKHSTAFRTMLDGYNWAPLSENIDIDSLSTKIKKELKLDQEFISFPEQMNRNRRSTDFQPNAIQ